MSFYICNDCVAQCTSFATILTISLPFLPSACNAPLKVMSDGVHSYGEYLSTIDTLLQQPIQWVGNVSPVWNRNVLEWACSQESLHLCLGHTFFIHFVDSIHIGWRWVLTICPTQVCQLPIYFSSCTTCKPVSKKPGTYNNTHISHSFVSIMTK